MQISRTSILTSFFLRWVQKKLEVQKARTTTSSGHNSQHPAEHICSITATKNTYWFPYSSRGILLLSYRLCITVVLQTILHPHAGVFTRCLYTKRRVLRSNPPSVATKQEQKNNFSRPSCYFTIHEINTFTNVAYASYQEDKVTGASVDPAS